MKRARILPAMALLYLMSSTFLPSSGRIIQRNIKQVRVVAERASVYIEPSRGSSRIDIISKGTLLNLLQTSKVKESWYYVSYSSSRYGTRVSGFVLDSAVELVGKTVPSVTEIKKPEEKAAIPPSLPPVRPEAKPSKEIKPETTVPPKEAAETKTQPPEPPRVSETLISTEAPKGKEHNFPLAQSAPRDAPWKIEKPAVPAEAEKPAPLATPKREPPPEKPKEPKIEKAVTPRVPTKKEVPPPEPKESQSPPGITRPVRLPGTRNSPGGVSILLGYGSSFGGAGGCLQVATAGGIALHAGAGIFPATLVYSDTDWVKNETLWSVGLKYYIPIRSPVFYPFLDIQYGGLRVEAAQVVTGIWDYDYVFTREQKSLWGPSVLAGVEIRKGRFGVCGALGISYVTTSWDYLQDKVALAFDTSLVVHF